MMTALLRLRKLVSLTLLAAVHAFFITSGCSSVQSSPPQPAPEKPGDASPPAIAPPGRAPDLERRHSDILADTISGKARSLLARPYRYGGSDPSGFDCSGFTSFIFASVGVALPRTTVQQSTIGHWVAADELRAGDLVFFGTSRSRPFHVGLVVSGPGEPLTMVHASTSRGVIETEIVSNSYWLPRLMYGRRAIQEP
jgi:cell wall-associated NlpC family hydrolase